MKAVQEEYIQAIIKLLEECDIELLDLILVLLQKSIH